MAPLVATATAIAAAANSICSQGCSCFRTPALGVRLRRMAPQPTIFSLFSSAAARAPAVAALKDDGANGDTTKPRKRLRRQGELSAEGTGQEKNGDGELEDNDSEMSSEGKSAIKEEEAEIMAKKGTKCGGGLFRMKQEEVPLWEPGTPVPWSHMTNAFDKIAETTKRIEKTDILKSAFLHVIRLTSAELGICVRLAAAEIGDPHEGIEIGLGDALLLKAVGEATGSSEKELKKTFTATGDLGIVAKNARSKQRTMFTQKSLTANHVFSVFREIAQIEGKSAQTRKRGAVTKLLTAAQGSEARHVINALQGNLRIGLASATVLNALGHATALASKEKATAEELDSAAETLRSVYSESPVIDEIVKAALEHGPWKLREHVKFRVGVPVRPMLAKPAAEVQEIFDKFGSAAFSCEYKYDGERAQIHYQKGMAVSIFSRNLETSTAKFEEISKSFERFVAEDVEDVVVDGEVVGYDRAAGKILSFQELSRRARKGGENAGRDQCVVCLYAFDCLYLNGQSLLQESLESRRKHLYSSLKAADGECQFAETMESSDVEEISQFLNDAITAGTEGLIVKSLSGDGSTYEPAKRSQNWIKLKKDYMDGVGDSIDAVVIGAYFGKGKRVGLYGAFLLAVYNDGDDDMYESICKIGTGFSEEILAKFHGELSPLELKDCPSQFRLPKDSKDRPDVFFKPKIVWEVKAADLTLSPTHMAAVGLVAEDRGIALRFPRFIRERDDKDPESATSSSQIATLFGQQASKAKN